MTDDDSSMNGLNGSGTGETGEAASPGRCPTGWQSGPGRHLATARMKWNRDMNIAVIECYYLSKSCLLYTSPSPRDLSTSRMPSSA